MTPCARPELGSLLSELGELLLEPGSFAAYNTPLKLKFVYIRQIKLGTNMMNVRPR